MDYKDFIIEDYYSDYVREKNNLMDRLIEARYNLLFLKMVNERSDAYHNDNDFKARYEIRFVLKRIYITVAYELALQIKSLADDNDHDCMTVNKFMNKIYRFLKTESKAEYNKLIKEAKSNWKQCEKLAQEIFDYRNKIVAHNFLNPPQLKFNICDADFVISQYENIFNVLCFKDECYQKRLADLDNEKTSFISAYLDAVLPLNIKLFLHSKSKGYMAQAEYNVEQKKFIVLKGSIVSSNIIYNDKLKNATLIEKTRRLYVKDSVVIENIEFKSPSAAASFITGKKINGRVAWKDENGVKLKNLVR